MSESALLEQAADWMLRLRDARASAETFLEWQRWLAAAPENRTAYEQVERAMSRLADLKSPPPLPDAAEMAADTYDGSISVSEYLEARRSCVRQGQHDSGANREYPLPHLPAWSPTVGSGRRHTVSVRYAMAACMVAALIVIGALGIAFFGASTAWQGTLAYETAPAQRQTVALPDGSTLTLGADSAVSVELHPHERLLRLTRGEAYFQVAKDAKRPFIVSAGETRVRAVGTEFNVRLSDRRTVVAVAEGVVRVSAPSYLEEASSGSRMAGTDRAPRQASILVTAQLGAGQAMAYEGASGLQALPAGDAALATTWLGGRRKYRNEPLQYVLADVHRYTGRRIEAADAATGALKFTGTLSVASSDAWFKALAIALPVKIVQEADGRLLVTSRASAAEGGPEDDSETSTGVDAPHAYIDI